MFICCRQVYTGPLIKFYFSFMKLISLLIFTEFLIFSYLQSFWQRKFSKNISALLILLMSFDTVQLFFGGGGAGGS